MIKKTIGQELKEIQCTLCLGRAHAGLLFIIEDKSGNFDNLSFRWNGIHFIPEDTNTTLVYYQNEEGEFWLSLDSDIFSNTHLIPNLNTGL